ncbi:hypothetical protein BVRB_2g029430 [Beta vulgaris subsp. vulgaris]|nr:hypothetical protein BVRB_2g029430 [Beta vulgaris subsp. vulgaris]
MVVQFFFAVAFSAVPLTLYVPPIRHLTLFVTAIQELITETTGYRRRVFPRFRRAFRFLLHPASST